MATKVLCVDDDPSILQLCRRLFRNQFITDTAQSGNEGVRAVKENGPYAVVVADMDMPDMNGVELLSQVRLLSPNTTRIMLTGNSDLQTAMDAVNQSTIFRFLIKPCEPTQILSAVQKGVEQYQLRTVEKDLLSNTLIGSVGLLTELLSIVNDLASSRALRVREWAKKIAISMEIQNTWKVEISAMLSQIGCVTLPNSVLEKIYRGQALTEQELDLYRSHPQIGARLVKKIPRLEGISGIILHQNQKYIDTLTSKKESIIPMESRILKVALDYDALLARHNENEALAIMFGKAGWYDPKVLEALCSVILNQRANKVTHLLIDELRPGMIFCDNVETENGIVLVARGQAVTESTITQLRNFDKTSDKVKVPVKVQVLDSSPFYELMGEPILA